METLEDIPAHLQPAVTSALSWLNEGRETPFAVTGLLGAERVDDVESPFELGLVLCDGEFCSREQIRIIPEGSSFRCELAAQAQPEIPPLLDPPVGLRSNWLEAQLEKFEFVLLLYYRGLW